MSERAARSTRTDAWSGVGETRSVELAPERPIGGAFVGDESDRTRLIGDISRLLLEPEVPESARSAGLELIGWLARRMPGESAHAVGVEEALESQRVPKSVRRKPR